MSKTQDIKVHPVEFNCKGVAVGKMRVELDVQMVRPWSEKFELATDEGKFHGGDATAPPPLALFTGGLVGCLMTQLRAMAKRLRIKLDDVTVVGNINWEAHQVGMEPYVTMPKSFQLDIDIKSQASQQEIENLVVVAKKACFIEQTLIRENVIVHRLTTDGNNWVSL